MIPTIGIVGGIGSGKSVAADAMQKLGGYLIAADRLGHEALLQPQIKSKLHERWGDAIFDQHGNADRKKIGAIVFADVAELRALEAQVLPYIDNRIVEELDTAQTRAKFIILDAAILFERGWSDYCDWIFFVDAPLEQRLARLKQNRGWSEEDVRKREKMQMPLAEKMKHADAVIVNDADAEKIAHQVQVTLEQWKVI